MNARWRVKRTSSNRGLFRYVNGVCRTIYLENIFRSYYRQRQITSRQHRPLLLYRLLASPRFRLVTDILQVSTAPTITTMLRSALLRHSRQHSPTLLHPSLNLSKLLHLLPKHTKRRSKKLPSPFASRNQSLLPNKLQLSVLWSPPHHRAKQ